MTVAGSSFSLAMTLTFALGLTPLAFLAGLIFAAVGAVVSRVIVSETTAPALPTPSANCA